jgi:iron complex transport system substrate-binding protein
MSRRRSAAVLIAAALLLAAPADWAGVSATDDLGRTVALEKPARRIVSLAPHVTELLFAAGAGDSVVGAVAYSDYPPAAREIPRVGSYDAVDMERILALQPDLVVGWASGNGRTTLDRLSELGLTVYASEPKALGDIASSIDRLGRLAGTSEKAGAASGAFRRRLAALRRRYSHERPVPVFYEIWNQPLLTVNGDHFISHLIRLCGGRNVFASLDTLVPTVDVEAVVAADPEAIVAGGRTAKRPPWLDDWRDWPDLRAVSNDHLYFIPPDLTHRPTPRLLDGAQRLCRQLDEVRRDDPQTGSPQEKTDDR